jgi:hypothetical protein
MNESQGFFRSHADTIAIIGVNLAMIGILLSICLSNISSIASANARTDNLMAMIHEESKNFYGRLEKQDADYKAHMMYYHELKEKK